MGPQKGQFRTTKSAVKKGLLENRDLQFVIDNYLFAYRNTPHCTTGYTPAELFLKRIPRTLITILKPNLAENIEKKKYSRSQSTQRDYYSEGEKVWVRSVGGEEVKWFPGATLRLRVQQLI